MISVALLAFQKLQKKSASVAMMIYSSCPRGLPFTSRVTPALVGDCQVEIRRWLVSSLVVFHRKRRFVSVSSGLS
jgi:hypothetical protein